MRRVGAWEQARAGGSVNQRTDWYMIEESQRSRKGARVGVKPASKKSANKKKPAKILSQYFRGIIQQQVKETVPITTKT